MAAGAGAEEGVALAAAAAATAAAAAAGGGGAGEGGAGAEGAATPPGREDLEDELLVHPVGTGLGKAQELRLQIQLNDHANVRRACLIDASLEVTRKRVKRQLYCRKALSKEVENLSALQENLRAIAAQVRATMRRLEHIERALDTGSLQQAEPEDLIDII